MQDNEDFHVEYNIELFAGMYFKHKKVYDPTIVFFRVGSYINSETFVNELIENFDKMKRNTMMK